MNQMITLESIEFSFFFYIYLTCNGNILGLTVGEVGSNILTAEMLIMNLLYHIYWMMARSSDFNGGYTF